MLLLELGDISVEAGEGGVDETGGLASDHHRLYAHVRARDRDLAPLVVQRQPAAATRLVAVTRIDVRARG